MNTFILTLIQLVIFVLYVGGITKKYGVLPSVSESWYKLPNQYKILFTLFVWGLAIPLFFYGNIWFALGAGFLSFVGAATQFKMTVANTDKIHYIGAMGGILLSLIGIAVKWSNLIPLGLFLISTLVLKLSKMKNETWWIEMVAFFLILAGLLVR